MAEIASNSDGSSLQTDAKFMLRTKCHLRAQNDSNGEIRIFGKSNGGVLKDGNEGVIFERQVGLQDTKRPNAHGPAAAIPVQVSTVHDSTNHNPMPHHYLDCIA